MKISEYLKIGEAAELLGVTENTLRNWEKDNKIKTYRNPMNDYRLYKTSELEILLQEIKVDKKDPVEKKKDKTLSYEERRRRVGDIQCWLCKNRWDGHIVLDDKCGFQLYCELCDVFIWMETGFKTFISLGNSGKVLNSDPKKLQETLDPHSKWTYEAKDHPIHNARKQREAELIAKHQQYNHIIP
jgi:excisionase family DNA binding protein